MPAIAVAECTTASDVLALARRVKERRQQFDERMRQRELAKQQPPQLEIVPPAPPPDPHEIEVAKCDQRGNSLVDFVLREESTIRAILNNLTQERLVGARPETKPPSIDEIQLAICGQYLIHRRDLIGPRRHKNLMRPRLLSYALCKHLTSCSFPIIGRLHGNRDHTTVLHGARRLDWLMEILDQELTPIDPVEHWVRRSILHLGPLPKWNRAI